MSKEEAIKQLCTNLRFLRERTGLSKTRMAKIMGVTTATLTKIEEGTLPRRTGVKSLLRLSDRFGIRLNHFFVPSLGGWTPGEGEEQEDDRNP